METLCFKNLSEFENVIKNLIFKKVPKLRFFENNKSYEDFTISYTLDGHAVLNFKVSEKDGKIVIKKRSPKSTRHIIFSPEKGCEVLIKIKNKKTLAQIFVEDTIMYTDGTHRYNK